jgi:hypothetical protein
MKADASLLLGCPLKKIGLILPPEKCCPHLLDEPENYTSGLTQGVGVSRIEEAPRQYLDNSGLVIMNFLQV